MLARVAQLTSGQIAQRIIETDLVAHLDSVTYFDRRVSWSEKFALNPQLVEDLLGGYSVSRSTRS